MFVDLPTDLACIEPHELRRGMHSFVHPDLGDACKSEHGFIKSSMSRIHLDEDIGAVIAHRTIDKDDVEQGGEPRPSRGRRVKCEFRKFAEAYSRAAAKAIKLILEGAIGRKASC